MGLYEAGKKNIAFAFKFKIICCAGEKKIYN